MSECRVLDSFTEVMPILLELFPDCLSLALMDKEKTLKYIYQGNADDRLKNNFHEGDMISQDTPAYAVMHTGKAFSGILPAEILGITCKVNIQPLRNNSREIIGAICMARSLKERVEIESVAGTIFESLQQTNSSVAEIADGSQKLVTTVNFISDFAKTTVQKIKESDSILSSIKNIASQSNLLALNAAIEATRAGDAGRGFSVVADEMRTMSRNSSESANKVSSTLLEIENSIGEIAKEINHTSEIAESQAAATQEITATLQEITSSADMLNSIAKVV